MNEAQTCKGNDQQKERRKVDAAAGCFDCLGWNVAEMQQDVVGSPTAEVKWKDRPSNQRARRQFWRGD